MSRRTSHLTVRNSCRRQPWSAVSHHPGLWQAHLDRLFVICGRTINFTRSLEGFAATVVSCGVPGVYLNRVGVVRDRLVDFPSRAVSEAAMIEGVGILRADLNCLREICDRPIVVALGLKGAAAA
jgi:hypothetical protein